MTKCLKLKACKDCKCCVVWFYGALKLLRSFSARTKFCQEFTDVFYSLFISSSALHLIAERLASVTADTSFIVFGLTRLRIEPSLPASKANALTLGHGFKIANEIIREKVQENRV